jgi:hypothetical protein
MKISEILIDILSETKLFEMAFNKKVAIDKARNLQNQIARHLVKILMYHNSQYVNHWCNEVNSWLYDIQDNKIKGTNKPLKSSELFNILFVEPLETIDDVQARMNRNYKEYVDLAIDEPNSTVINEKLYWIIKSICDDLQNNQFNRVEKYLQ